MAACLICYYSININTIYRYDIYLHFSGKKLSFSVVVNHLAANRRQINATACYSRVLQSQPVFCHLFSLFFFSFDRFRFGLQRQQSIDQAIKRAKAAPVMSKSLCPGWQRGNVAARQRIRQAAGDGQSMANDGGCLHSKMTKQLKNN